MTTRRAETASAVVADLLALVVFVALGVHAHHHHLTFGTYFAAWYPFGAALVIAALVRPNAPHTLRTGSERAVITVAVGMVLRVVVGQGTAVSFCIVATVFVSLFFSLWRFAEARRKRR